jgi:hypothetical protein
MKPIILYCKSFSRDVERAKVLLKSILQNNKDNIPFYISVPSEDVQLFKNALGTNGYTLVTDEEVLGRKLEQSWLTQQTIKSSFWKLGLCDNYVMIDSDSYFIRPFYQKDFIVEGTENIPYTVMHEQKDLFSWTIKNTQVLGFDPQLSFSECRTPIQQLFDRPGRLYDFGPGPIIWSTKVWSSLEEQYLKPNDLTFEQLVNTVHSEFSWYGEWLLTSKTIPLWPCEPLFKFFHYKQWYEEYKKNGYDLGHWARNYLGVVMQSSSGLPLEY